MKDVSTVWSRAAHAIRTFGWTQGTLADNNGRVCLIGSILVGTGHSHINSAGRIAPIWPVQWPVQRAGSVIFSCLNKVTETLGSGIREQADRDDIYPAAFWNDQDGRTREEVLDLLQELHEKELAEKGVLGGNSVE